MPASAQADLRPPHRYVLPEGLRRELAAAFGPVVQSGELVAALDGADPVVAVGDVVSLTLKKLDLTPRLFVCDFLTQRGEPDPTYEAELGAWGRLAFRVANPAATVTREAWDAIRLGLQHDDGPVRVVVEGEEGDKGAAPWEGELGEGEHTVEARSPKFGSEKRTVRVACAYAR